VNQTPLPTTGFRRLTYLAVAVTFLLVVVGGIVRIEAGGETLEAGIGTLVKFEPDERHVVASDTGAKILLLLAPWPGEGHYRGSEPPPNSP
jgi:hypothetical protein